MEQYVANISFTLKGKEIKQGTLLDTRNSGLSPVDFTMLLRLGRVSPYRTVSNMPSKEESPIIGTRSAIALNENVFVQKDSLAQFKDELKTKFVSKKKTKPIVKSIKPESKDNKVEEKIEKPIIKQSEVKPTEPKVDIVPKAEETKVVETIATETEVKENVVEKKTIEVVAPNKNKRRRRRNSEAEAEVETETETEFEAESEE